MDLIDVNEIAIFFGKTDDQIFFILNIGESKSGRKEIESSVQKEWLSFLMKDRERPLGLLSLFSEREYVMRSILGTFFHDRFKNRKIRSRVSEIF